MYYNEHTVFYDMDSERVISFYLLMIYYYFSHVLVIKIHELLVQFIKLHIAVSRIGM